MPRLKPVQVCLAYGALAGAYLLIPSSSVSGSTVYAAVRIVPALGAALACAAALRSLPRSASGPWLLLAAVPFAGVAAGIAAITQPAVPGATGWMFLTMALFALAMVWLIHQRDRGRGMEIVLDAALVLVAVTVLVLRWAPFLARVLPGPAIPGPFRAGLLAGPIAGLCAAAFASALLATWRGATSRGVAAALAGAAALLALSAFHVVAAPRCCGGHDPLVVSAIAGWGLLSCGVLCVRANGADSFLACSTEAGGLRLRQHVAPLVALVMAVTVVEAPFRQPIGQPAAAALGLLGALLALRVSNLLEATRERSKERRQLEQSRALVEVSRALSGTTGLDETLQLVTSWTCRLLNAHAAGIELLSSNGQMLEFRAAAGFPPTVLGMRFPVEGSFTGWVVKHNRPRATVDPERDPHISEESRALLRRCPTAAAPLRYHDRVLGALVCVAQKPFDGVDFELLGALADQAAIAIENARLFQQVHRLSRTDPLTGLSNRRQLEHDLAREFAAARRGRDLSAVIFDINDFKEYNDLYGHLAGDEVLRLFGEVLGSETRAMNLAARYGGDEFVTLLADTDRNGARLFVERVRSRFAELSADLGRRPLTVAAGFAEFTPDMEHPDALIAAADRALYRSKADPPRAC